MVILKKRIDYLRRCENEDIEIFLATVISVNLLL